MRTGGIIRIIVGLVIAVVLTIFLVGALSGFNLFEKLGWHTGWSTGWFRSGTEASVDDGSTVVSETASVPAAGVSRINVNWVSGNVEVRVGDGDQITFFETASRALTDAQKMRYTVSPSGVLQIKFCAELDNVMNWFENGNYNMPDKALVLTVPASMLGSLDTLNIDSVSARLEVDGVYGAETILDTVSGKAAVTNIDCEQLRLNSTSGTLQCDACKAEKLNLDSVSGNIRVNGTFTQISAETVSGEVRIACVTAPEKINVDSVSGSVNVQLPENAGFTAKLDTVSGSLSCEFPGTLSDKMVVVGDGSAAYRFDTVSGSIRIEQYE